MILTLSNNDTKIFNNNCKIGREHYNRTYVPDGEIAWWAEHNDPIIRYEKYLADNSILTADEMTAIAKDIKEFLNAESDRAETEPMPEAITAAYNVFDNNVMPPAFKKKVLER